MKTEDKYFFIMESRKPMAAELKAIREAKKIHVTKLAGKQSIYKFEKNPTNTRASSIESYMRDVNVEVIFNILHGGQYNTKSFSEGFRYAIKIRGVRIKDIARATGYSVAQIEKHVSGRVDMPYHRIETLCKALRIKLRFRNLYK